ncbi:MAG: 1-acyl-sn-glycerol-3-phosphate acyltransferase [Gammaproteobacteria bacterium]|nr:1-acyl-sn-glycerol-3-phosphate acyltransferase [Gammaproteobacteria bacterium]
MTFAHGKHKDTAPPTLHPPMLSPTTVTATAREPPAALLARVIFGSYAWLVFIAIAFALLLLLLVVPGMDRRRHLAGVASRLILRLTFTRLVVTGAEHLPAGQCVVAANHASYIDAIVIKAVLPENYAYVVKREMANVPLAGLLLRRIGTEFVERFNRHKGSLDARRVLRTASAGQSLLFFPEGTFEGEPGLLKFHSGAFKSAAYARCPVVPCVIRGTRAILQSPRFFPRPGLIEVELLPPILPPADLESEDVARQLREQTRAAILERLGEPDRGGVFA